jgi:hypothetical protein
MRLKCYLFGCVGEAGGEGAGEASFDFTSSTFVLIVASLVNGELGYVLIKV